MRILVHAINHIGLGHLSRTLTITKWIKEIAPDTEILFLVEAENDILNRERVPWIRIPSIHDFALPRWENISCKMQQDLVTHITDAILSVFSPDIVIYDAVVWDPIWEAVQRTQARQVFIARMGKLVQHLLTSQPQKLASLDLFLVPHDSEEMASYHELFHPVSERLIYAGPIVQKSREELDVVYAKNKYKLQASDFKVIISAGGGGWNQTGAFFDKALSALASFKEKQLRIILVTGPHFQGYIENRSHSKLDIVHFEPCLMDLVAACNLFICQAGYNTLNEAREIGIPTICIPMKEADDQIERANYFNHKYPNIKVCDLEHEQIVDQVHWWLEQPIFMFENVNSISPIGNKQKIIDTILQLGK